MCFSRCEESCPLNLPSTHIFLHPFFFFTSFTTSWCSTSISDPSVPKAPNDKKVPADGQVAHQEGRVQPIEIYLLSIIHGHTAFSLWFLPQSDWWRQKVNRQANKQNQKRNQRRGHMFELSRPCLTKNAFGKVKDQITDLNRKIVSSSSVNRQSSDIKVVYYKYTEMFNNRDPQKDMHKRMYLVRFLLSKLLLNVIKV